MKRHDQVNTNFHEKGNPFEYNLLRSHEHRNPVFSWNNDTLKYNEHYQLCCPIEKFQLSIVWNRWTQWKGKRNFIYRIIRIINTLNLEQFSRIAIEITLSVPRIRNNLRSNLKFFWTMIFFFFLTKLKCLSLIIQNIDNLFWPSFSKFFVHLSVFPYNCITRKIILELLKEASSNMTRLP